MGRPLKIQKIISTGNPGVDNGFNAFNQLTAPALPTGGTMESTMFLGVTGGVQPPTLATATYPIVKCEVYIADSYSGQTAGQIIRQKGARKFMVATTTPIDPENAVVGVTLRIAVVGDTNWQAMGAPAGAGIGTIFTPTAASAAGTSGTAQEVGTCVLTSDLTPTSGNMSISFFNTSDSVEQAVSKLTNKFLSDFTGGETGGSANTGDVWDYTQVAQNVRYDANFFSDEGTEIKSGAEADTFANSTGELNLAIVENYNS